MKRWINRKHLIIVDDFDERKCSPLCPDCYYPRLSNYDNTGCSFYKTFNENANRCQACIDDDITDKLNRIEELEKRNRVLERARELVKEDFCTATFENSLKKAKKEYESEDSDAKR